MPKTGPSDGSREVMMTFFDMREPCVKLMEVTVFFPAAVGVVRSNNYQSSAAA